MYTRRSHCLSQAPAWDWKGWICGGDDREKYNHRKEASYGFWHCPAFVSWRCPWRSISSHAGSYYLARICKTTETRRVQYNSGRGGLTWEVKEHHRHHWRWSMCPRLSSILLWNFLTWLRYLLVSAFPTFDPRKPVCTHGWSTWGWVIRRKSLISSSFMKTQVFSSQLPKTYFPPRRNSHQHTPLSNFYKTRANCWRIILKILTTSRPTRALTVRRSCNATVPLQRQHAPSALPRFPVTPFLTLSKQAISQSAKRAKNALLFNHRVWNGSEARTVCIRTGRKIFSETTRKMTTMTFPLRALWRLVDG